MANLTRLTKNSCLVGLNKSKFYLGMVSYLNLKDQHSKLLIIKSSYSNKHITGGQKTICKA